MSKKQFISMFIASLVFSFLGGVFAVSFFSASFAQAQHSFFDSLAVGMPLSNRGEAVRIKGWTILGQAGARGGKLTFMPPDGTGWYHIDNGGGQALRITGGGHPGQYSYMTIRHPGNVTVHGNLDVKGQLSTQGKIFQAQKRKRTDRIGSLQVTKVEERDRGGSSRFGAIDSGKADSHDTTSIWVNIARIEKKVNEIIEQLNNN